ncbi:MAG: hypothetical protein JWO92_300 [Chitinophagaceae bacterium]|nr:hypothetical protein [Chitinophagaceae bacterium]
MKKTFLPNLKTCIILDVIGCLSYIIPPFGPVWAIISGIIFYFMFGKKLGVFGGIFSFLEELIPVVDFIPTFTIAWFMRRSEPGINENKKMHGNKALSH